MLTCYIFPLGRDHDECLFLCYQFLTCLFSLVRHCNLFSLLFPPAEEMVEGKSAILIGMSQWNSNDLVEQIETIGKLEENQGNV